MWPGHLAVLARGPQEAVWSPSVAEWTTGACSLSSEGRLWLGPRGDGLTVALRAQELGPLSVGAPAVSRRTGKVGVFLVPKSGCSQGLAVSPVACTVARWGPETRNEACSEEEEEKPRQEERHGWVPKKQPRPQPELTARPALPSAI